MRGARGLGGDLHTMGEDVSLGRRSLGTLQALAYLEFRLLRAIADARLAFKLMPLVLVVATAALVARPAPHTSEADQSAMDVVFSAMTEAMP